MYIDSQDHRTNSGIVVKDKALGWSFSRSSGPGGQGVNTADSRVQLTCLLSELEGPDDVLARIISHFGEKVVVTSSESRSQLQNRSLALAKLISTLDEASRVSKSRRKTRVPRAVKEARLDQKRRVSEIKRARRATFN